MRGFHKKRLQSEGLFSAGILQTKGSSDVDVYIFLCKCKNFGFFEFMVCPHGQGGGGWARQKYFISKGDHN